MKARSDVGWGSVKWLGAPFLVVALAGSFGLVGTFMWYGYQARAEQEWYQQSYYDLAKVCFDRDGTMKQAEQGAVCIFRDGTTSELHKPQD
jgi:hypothetical protein